MHNIDRIKSIVDQSPTKPGIYKMLDQNNNVLYVGKAKNIKNRLKNYLNDNNLTNRIRRLMRSTKQIDTIITETEKEALLLEANLIKKIKPQYNILLRDDKSFPYIFINHEQEYPSISKHRGKQKFKGKYFGPFATVGSLNYTLKILQKVFQLRSCEDSYFENRSRPCLMHQIERCSAPCVGLISKNQYAEDLIEAKNHLTSSDSQTIKKLQREIYIFAKRLEFEKAAAARDKIERINIIHKEQSVNIKAKDIDIFSIHYEDNYVGISIIVVRKGKIRGTKTHFIKKAYFDSFDDIYHAVILNFYDTQYDIPNKILCAHNLESKDLITKAVKKKFKTAIQITHNPSKSIRPIFSLCKLNSKQVIENHLSKSDKYNFAIHDLSKYLGINNANLTKIEAFDVSHISGSHAVASCVVFSNIGPEKKNYRLFNIPKELSGNDVGSLESVIKRRLKYYDDKKVKPNLILIDGGKNQLNFVENVISKSNHKDIKVISIVKGFNRIRATESILSKDGIVEFDKRSKGFLLLQEIRDESHRFAINAQRKKKRGAIKKSKLDKIHGIGNILKKRLLNKFKSIENIKLASEKELMTVEGISAKIANLIMDKIK